jgi:putative transcriptional regulator
LNGIEYMITQLATASPAQRKVLHTLTDIGREATVVEIADRLGIHKNSVRETLVPLVEQGLVVRRTHNPEGRGRPAMYYEIAVIGDAARLQRQSSELLLAAASAMAQTSDGGEQLADIMGRNWGQQYVDLIRESGAFDAARDDQDALFSLLRVFLSTRGFRAENTDDGNISINSCPYVGIGDTHIQRIVCRMHGSAVRHIVEELSNGAISLTVVPFADDCGCRVIFEDIPVRQAAGE